MKVQPNVDGRPVWAWVKCAKCNNAKHLILPGDKTPYWWCQDEKQQLREGQEIEVEYVDDENFGK